MGHLKDSVRAVPSSNVLQIILAAAFLIPLTATLFQFADSGFLAKQTPFLVLFWPGIDWRWAPAVPVWLAMGIMGISYLAGISYMLRHRTFGKVVLWSVAAIIVAQLLSFGVNHFTGWKELGSVSSMNLVGKVNAAIFAQWQNPIWEEIVFRGLPLLLVFYLRKKGALSSRWVDWGYIIIPNIVFAIYHVPGHGPSRLVDTMVLGCAFSWMALRYSFFAPVVMHYVLDAMLVVSISKIPNIPTEEIPWLVQNTTLLNSSWSLAILAAMLSLPVIVLWNTFRASRRSPVSLSPGESIK